METCQVFASPSRAVRPGGLAQALGSTARPPIGPASKRIARRGGAAMLMALGLLVMGLTGSVPAAFAAAPVIEEESVANVSGTSATLEATINPEGSETTYHFEYGPDTSYGTSVPAPDAPVGSGSNAVTVTLHPQALKPSTTYHFRVVATATASREVSDGADQTFTTQRVGGEFSLLDGRQWELVSPPQKKGAFIGPKEQGDTVAQAAENGQSFTYLASLPLASGISASTIIAQIFSTRSPLGGWTSQDIETPHEKPVALATVDGEGAENEYRFFSPDLSSAVVEPVEMEGETPLTSETKEPTVYLRNNATGAYRALITPADVPANTKYGFRQRRPEFLDATPDTSHVIVGSPEKLTSNAIEANPNEPNGANNHNLYEWANGHLELINLLPDGKATEGRAVLARAGAMVTGAVSNDGRRVVWQHTEENYPLYMRDMTRGVTVQLGGPNAFFQRASADDSLIFFNEVPVASGTYDGTLEVYDAETGTTTDLTVPLNAGESPGVESGLMGMSEDGTYVYFVAKGVLADRAVSGEDNLYLVHLTSTGWKTTFIATLSPEDQSSWENYKLSNVSARVSPDGRYLAFMSNRSLTGYDNVDAVSDQRDEEVYLYDADTAGMVCASCDPTGARPQGVFDPAGQEDALLVDPGGGWTERQGTGPHWLAGSIPGWAPSTGAEYEGIYQSRYLSNSGRLFFNSPIGLVPQDTNGVEDVYEYEPADIGSCTTSSVTFSARSDGCVDLVTSGTSADESAFFDASGMGPGGEEAEDVFFVTTSRLTAQDEDTSYDVYDAHTCSAVAPCVPETVTPPPCSTADSCKPAPSPQPAVFGPPASSTFSGTGNLQPVITTILQKHKKKAKHPKRRRHKRPRTARARRGKRSAKRRGHRS